jgi:predicted transcriptional regulator
MAKDKFAANANRIDPYKSFRFRLRKAVVDSGKTIGRITRLPINRLRQALRRSDKG